ncbi:peptide deformylase [Yoonia sediminilitoris]|uniref:Peptide deformylase n=1 Tax=Yoonia sediminilitoris TaxID=1286148 RepID=A0A2T6KFR5_9RHOB|nr:peptide deformylase [Yoonia sediminilitoris]PUB14148.1 peptide deformylase [Yoonia sediminilitoris]RCW95079.1 peptide deformylase [Yoonia sediminilitoris]
MAVLALRYIGDPVLAQVCTPVRHFDAGLDGLVADMFETMYAAPGRGLAAPQIGVTDRLFVIDTTWKEGPKTPRAFVNPRITDMSADLAVGTEGCLSIPDRTFAVPRPHWIDLTWQDLDGQQKTGRFEDVEAVCICHELDHLDGKLITQTGTEQ